MPASEPKPKYFEAFVLIDERIPKLQAALKFVHVPKHAIGPALNQLIKVRELQRQGLHQIIFDRNTEVVCSCGLVTDFEPFEDDPNHRDLTQGGAAE